MKESEPRRCVICGMEFIPSVYTAHNQKICKKLVCRKAANRVRRKKFTDKMKDDVHWRIRRSQLVSECRKRKQERELNAAKIAVDQELQRHFETSTTKAIVAGMVSFICKAATAETLLEFLAKMKARGRKLLGPCAGFGKLVD